MSFSSFLDISIQRAHYYTRQAIPFLKRVLVDFARTHRLWRRRRDGFFDYTIVSAVYNVAPYLGDFFRSLTEQVLNFERHIQVILIDDGSTDDSAAIIKRWKARYPHNISYIRKDNGGQGSARNAGIPLARTPWITFIDPDDFVDVTYFAWIDTFLSKHHREDQPETHIHLLGCNLIFYHERSGRFRDTHPLRGKFAETERLFPIANLDEFMHLSASSAFFRTSELKRQKICFDERHWPSFEDAHFVARYLQGLVTGQVALARYPRYYYRKRKTDDSSLNIARQNKRYYLDQMQDGVLGLLEDASIANSGYPPSYIQRVVLYHLWWRIKAGINFPAPCILNADEILKYYSLLYQCFSYITPEIISSIQKFCPAVSWIHIVGMLHLFKNTMPIKRTFISKNDRVKKQIRLTYYAGRILEEQVLDNGKLCVLYDGKTTAYTFGGHPFCIQRQFWVNAPKGDMEVRMEGESARIVLGKDEHFYFAGGQIEQHFTPPPLPFFAKRYARSWVFADRDTQADDNAEHFYRYVMRRHPDRKIYFALCDSSHDWARLEREGFALLRIGGWKYSQAIRGCSLIISSQIEKYLISEATHKPYVFLRHGVVKDDLSNWMNPKKLDLVLTSIKPEYDAIVEDGSPYVLSTRETRLTGLPRHDALISSIAQHDNMLLVMPTWRKYLKKTLEQSLFADFMESPYAQYWKSFLASESLRRIVEEQGMRIVFSPHANMQKSLSYFGLPSHVTIAGHAGSSIQALFKQAAIMITDYSSVAFEMAYLKKTVLYYQFDRKDVFSGSHTTLKGYYDYARDGFGPVAEDEETLLRHLELIVGRGGTPDPEYLRRMEEIFPFSDGRCCERVYKAIEELESPLPFTRRPDS